MKRAFQIVVSRKVPAEVRDMIWVEFYQSRQRGRTLALHSPWIQEADGHFCLVAVPGEGLEPIGTLIVREDRSLHDSKVAMIGYVCVVPAWRRQGVSRALVAKAIELAHEQRYAALVLWTQKPEVYASHGFVASPQDIYRQYPALTPRDPEMLWVQKDWCEPESAGRGLPAFASRARVVYSGQASIVVLETLGGPAIAEWRGQDNDVVELIGCAIPGSWWLNADAGDSLLSELDRRGVAVLQDVPSRKWILCFDGCSPGQIPTTRLLDRI